MNSGSANARLSDEPDQWTPKRARQLLCDRLEAAGWPMNVVGDACLVLSEVVTNALVHGGGVVSLEMDLSPTVLRVGVGDRSTAPLVQRDGDASVPGGRGLAIVDRLCDAWGVVRRSGPAAKVVWFTIHR